MAPQLALIRRDDFTTDVESLNLLSGGFDLRDWVQAIASDDDRSVSESLTLKITGTSQDNLAVLIQSLDEKIKQANWQRQSVEPYSIWLRAKMGNETGIRQALVLAARRSPGVQLFDNVAGSNDIAREYQLGLERIPWWETEQSVTFTQASVNSLGGASAYGGTPIKGTHPARIANAFINGLDASLSDVWMGLRTARFGTLSEFKPVWNLRLAGVFGTDTTGGASNPDATAQDGFKVVVAFSSSVFLPRLYIKVADIEATPSKRRSQRGRFSLLMRAKVTSTAVARVRIGNGYVGSTTYDFKDRVTISSTSWKLYAMGEVRIAPSRLKTFYVDSDFLFSGAGFRLDAERVSGSGNLELDCFILIPTAEGSLHLNSVGGFTTSDTANVDNRADGELSGFVSTSGTPIETLALDARDWGLPPPSGNFIVAGQRPTESVKTDTIQIIGNLYERYATLRGST